MIAGTIGGIIANGLDILMGTMGMTTLRFVDWMSIILFGHIPPFTFVETVFSFLSQVFFCGCAGVAFIYLVPVITSKNLYLKSWYVSMFIWYGIDGITTLYKIEGTLNLPVITLISNAISATIFAFVLAQCLTRFEHTNDMSLLTPHPAMKPLNVKHENEDDKQEK